MFSTLENTWDRSARRGWSTLASFTFQALALSLLLVLPIFWIQGPPRLLGLQPLTAPVAQAPVPPSPPERQPVTTSSNMIGIHLLAPQSMPRHAAEIHDTGPISPPDLPNGVWGATGSGSATGILNSIGNAPPAVIPPPAPAHPIRISHWAVGNLVYRVQPVYPPLARQVRVQGPVQLRAIISKTGTIERLTVESGHPMLVKAAIDAVQQWRYRPYLLNNEPVEIETEITVNFVLSPS
jgi:periplasmic protein TonB